MHAIGQRAAQIDGVPFDHAAGHIEHHDGLVIGKDHTFVSGWAAHAGGGGIAESRKHAKDLASSIMQFLESRNATSSSKDGLGHALPDDVLCWDEVLRRDPWRNSRSGE